MKVHFDDIEETDLTAAAVMARIASGEWQAKVYSWDRGTIEVEPEGGYRRFKASPYMAVALSIYQPEKPTPAEGA